MRKTERQVLTLRIASAETEDETTIADVVDGDGHLRHEAGLRYPVLATNEPSASRGMATASAASTVKHSMYPSSSMSGSSGKSTPARRFSSALLLGSSRWSLT